MSSLCMLLVGGGSEGGGEGPAGCEPSALSCGQKAGSRGACPRWAINLLLTTECPVPTGAHRTGLIGDALVLLVLGGGPCLNTIH